jgi:hypothetical protein
MRCHRLHGPFRTRRKMRLGVRIALLSCVVSLIWFMLDPVGSLMEQRNSPHTHPHTSSHVLVQSYTDDESTCTRGQAEEEFS